MILYPSLSFSPLPLHSFIHSFKKYLLAIYYTLDTILRAGNAKINKSRSTQFSEDDRTVNNYNTMWDIVIKSTMLHENANSHFWKWVGSDCDPCLEDNEDCNAMWERCGISEGKTKGKFKAREWEV